MSHNIAVILPSRGLVFSKTVEELLRELSPYKHKIFWSHGRPIPDCFEIPTQEILKDKSFTHLLTVEEDMIIPEGAIGNLLAADTHAVAYDYPVLTVPSGCALYDTDTTAFYTGCGLLLVKIDIVRRMVFPIWRTDIAWNMKHKQSHIEFTIAKNVAQYGQQDIAFGLRLYLNNLPIQVMPDTTGQRKLVQNGKANSNQGTHTIMETTETVKLLNTFVEPDFTTVIIDGEPHNLYTPDANNLLRKGLAKLDSDPNTKIVGRAKINNLSLIEDWVYLR
jgi:hypothetical protein